MRRHAIVFHSLARGLVCAAIAAGCCRGEDLVATTGFVSDTSGAPVLGADVSLTPAPQSDCREAPDQGKTIDAGEFAVAITFSRCTKRPDFILRIEKDGFEPYEKHFSKIARNLRITLTPKAKKLKGGQNPDRWPLKNLDQGTS